MEECHLAEWAECLEWVEWNSYKMDNIFEKITVYMYAAPFSNILSLPIVAFGIENITRQQWGLALWDFFVVGLNQVNSLKNYERHMSIDRNFRDFGFDENLIRPYVRSKTGGRKLARIVCNKYGFKDKLEMMINNYNSDQASSEDMN